MTLLNKIIIFIFTLLTVVAISAADINDQREVIARKPYLINLMRINEKVSEENTYIFPEKEAVGYFRVVRAWAKNNPHSKKLYVWYDSKHVTKQQIQNTRKRLSDEHDSLYKADLEFVNQYDAKHSPEFAKELSDDKVCKVILRDVREIPLVRNNIDVFSEKMSIYFRVDLLRVLVADYLAKNEGEKGYIVYSDFNVPWMSYKQLFVARERQHKHGYMVLDDTVKDLEETGLVLAENNKFSFLRSSRFENGFFIFDASNILMLKACRLALIDTGIIRAKKAIKNSSYLQSRDDQQYVYGCYSNAIKLYHYFNLKGKIIDDPFGNPNSESERLRSYNDCTKLFDIDKPWCANFKFDAIIMDSIGEYRREFKEHESMAEALKIKQVEKPISSFYTNLNYEESARRQRDNERLKYIGLLQ